MHQRRRQGLSLWQKRTRKGTTWRRSTSGRRGTRERSGAVGYSRQAGQAELHMGTGESSSESYVDCGSEFVEVLIIPVECFQLFINFF